MRIAVVGAGGMGGYYAALLARAGAEITLIARGEHLRAIRRSGLRVEGSASFSIAIRAVERPAEVGPADLVLVCVKSYDLEGVANGLGPLLHQQTAVLALQNGVEHGDRLAAILGPRHAFAGASYIVSQRAGPGRIVHTNGQRIDFGPWDGGADQRCAAIAAALTAAGIEATAVPDIRRALWLKFINIVALGSVNCLTRAPAAVWRDLPEVQRLIQGIAAEVAAVGLACGVNVAGAADSVLDRLVQLGPAYSTSMLADLLAGAPLELETLQGAVVRLGRAHDVPTPRTETVYTALLPFAQGRTE